ncbi:50S ribosomal protein L10 [Candidatus Micrarchaeota archaeon]|nr:50S ribosomal protein L10 [Candidatus Micrarchaeota archaeon]
MARKVKGLKKKKKQETLERVAKQLQEASVVALIDLRNLPDSQFQSVKKKLRGKATFAVVKSNLIKLAIEKTGKAKELLEHIKGPSALVFSSINPFELFKFMKQNKGKAAAKPGQIAPFDLIVPAGETTLPPGPVLSELKTAGIDARIAGGKVVIGKDSTVAKTGVKIKPEVAKALQKLGIQPFEVMVRIPAVWETGVVYAYDVLNIDEEKFMRDLSSASGQAFNLSFNIAYPTTANISLLIAKAVNDSRNLAFNAEIYEKEIIDLLLAKANAQAKALQPLVKLE